MNFEEAPLLVIWETTQACDLACVHCRASANPARNPAELSTGQAKRMIDMVRSFGDRTMLVFTGGDPLKRADLYDQIRYAVGSGIRTNVTPSATPLLTTQVIDDFQALGINRMAISLDGADAGTHDSFRQVPGTFDRAMTALRHAKEIGLDTQLQTTVTRLNMHQLPRIAERVAEINGRMWSLFFLIVTGRAQAEQDLTAEEYEQVFGTLYDLSKVMPFEIKTTEGMHYRRYVARRLAQEHGPEAAHTREVMYRTAGVSDGRGFVFVSHTGEIYPSGFLPLSAGNVKQDSLVDVYRNAPLFRSLRDTSQRGGKCGDCEYTKLCGGSRARAYALTGDYLAQDPRCVYIPARQVAKAAPALVGV